LKFEKDDCLEILQYCSYILVSLFRLIIVTRLPSDHIPTQRAYQCGALHRITYEIVDSRRSKWVMADSYINRYVIATMLLYVHQVNERKGENRS